MAVGRSLADAIDFAAERMERPSNPCTPMKIEIQELSAGLNPSAWRWKITTTFGGRTAPPLAVGQEASAGAALDAAGAAVRALYTRL